MARKDSVWERYGRQNGIKTTWMWRNIIDSRQSWSIVKPGVKIKRNGYNYIFTALAELMFAAD